MKYIEYGKNNEEIIILLHGGGLSWWNYKEIAEQLQDTYHVILPILDGHSGSDRNFTTIEENATEIITFINEKFNGHILCIGGLSLGAQILIEILSKEENICDYAIIESALVIPMKMTYKLIRPTFSLSYGLISKKWFSKLQFKSIKIKKELFDYYYKDTCNIKKKDMIKFLEESSNYCIKNSLQDTNSRVLIIVGDKEKSIMKKSAILINEIIPNSEIEVIPNYCHGDLSINHPDEYIELFNKLLEDNSKKLIR